MISKQKDKQILACIVDNYINTGMPIGSSNLIKKYQLKWSSSTVRSVFHDLMQKGYLRQEHISSGRVPTEKGVRTRIDDLVNTMEISHENKENQANDLPTSHYFSSPVFFVRKEPEKKVRGESNNLEYEEEKETIFNDT